METVGKHINAMALFAPKRFVPGKDATRIAETAMDLLDFDNESYTPDEHFIMSTNYLVLAYLV